MVVSLLRGQFAWRPLYSGQLSRGQFAAVSCRVPLLNYYDLKYLIQCADFSNWGITCTRKFLH